MNQIGAFLFALSVTCAIYLIIRWAVNYNERRSVQKALNNCAFGCISKEGEVRVTFENLWYKGDTPESICGQVKYHLSQGKSCYIKLNKYKLDNLVVDEVDCIPNLYFVQDYEQFDKHRYRLKPTPFYRVYLSLNNLKEYFEDVDNPTQNELEYVQMVLSEDELKMYKEFKND